MTQDSREDAVDEEVDTPVLEELDGLLSELSGEPPPEALVAAYVSAKAHQPRLRLPRKYSFMNDFPSRLRPANHASANTTAV